MISPVNQASTAPEVEPSARREDLWRLSQSFEANFLNEMLKSSGLNATSESFGGGPGEDAFSSLLTQTYADSFAASGGIGLAEHIYKSLVERGAGS